MSEEEEELAPTVSPHKAMVVGIGASAGGLKVLKTLFSLLPGDSDLSYVVVVHLSPEHPSHLADLLQPHSKMPVVQISGTTPLEPNHVYVIPPGRNLSTIDTHLRLSELEKHRRERAPIDHFFETLATTHQDQCIGLILSGTGSDGTLGIKKIKEAGGVTLVQDPNEAEFDGMPQSAIATELVDLVLPIRDMPGYILRISRTQPRIPDTEETIQGDEEQILQHIFAQLRSRTGQDFSKYKRSTVLRRLRRRMQLQQQERLEDYLVQLREHPHEVRLLAEDFLITVTQFFRDPETYEYLEKKIIPALFKGKQPGEKLRIWSVGCATGEEAYSLAMLMLESPAQARHPLELQVFASDLHEHSLHRAREGAYPETISGDVSPERLQRFFTRQDNSYRIRKDLREIVVFANHNLLKDPPFSRMDLIVCRNVLIYLQRDVQHDVMDLFHYALNPDGLLLLGPSETVDRTGLFRVESKKYAIYLRRNVPPPDPRLPVFFNPFRRERTAHPPLPQTPPPVISYGSLHQKVVERHAPPSILVNQKGQAVHVSQHAGRYLRIGGGDMSTNLYKLAREELRLELRTALQAAASGGKPVRSKPVVLRLDGEPRQVFIQVHPARNEDTEGFFLVLFDETDGIRSREGEGVVAGGDDQRAELESVRTQLRTVVEQYETSQEEMKAANEELQSSNEELRSAMEELETSKEELQSMNEELQTVNQENRHKVEELSQLTSDLNSLMSSTEIATLFLDQDLRIMRVMPLIPDLFNIRGSDRGRPLTDFTNRFGYDRLVEDAERVLERLVPVEREVETQDGKCYMMRILPYRSGDRIKGVVITFIEITERRRAETAMRESEERFRALVNASSDIVYRVGPDWTEMRELDGRGLIADTLSPTTEWLDKYIVPADLPVVKKAIQHAVKHREKFEMEHRVILADGGVGWMLSRAVPVLDEKGGVREWFGAASDITARRQAEEVLREADIRKDQFLATLGHELRNPLAPIRTALELLKLRLPDDPELQELRVMMERQVLVMRRLVDDLLDVSRIKSGRVLLQKECLDLRDVVGNAAASMEQAIKNKRHRLDLSQSSESLVVDGDPLRLGQIITNLLDNAVKYTPPEGHIRVRTRVLDGHAEVSVRDNGIGIPGDILGNVFDLFTQGGRGASGYGGGLGIGLTLVRQLVEMHGGRIEALSKGEGKGSEFIMRLPLATDEEEVDPSPSSKLASRPAAAQSQPRRILLVEDNQDVSNSLAMALIAAGHEVSIAADGATALKQCGKFKPEVALIDIGLPDMDGHAVARELSASRSPPRLLIAISGYGQNEDRARSTNSGIDHHLVKPVDTAELLRLIAGGGKDGKKKREEKN